MRMPQLVGIPGSQAGHIELFDELAVAQACFILKIGAQSERQRKAALTQAHGLKLLFPFGCDAGTDQQLAGRNAL